MKIQADLENLLLSAAASGFEKNKLFILDKLKAVGLDVKLIISDVGSSNQVLVKELGVTDEKPWFIHNGEKVFFIYDPPHLIKCTRNNLKNHNIVINGSTIAWKFIYQFYKRDICDEIRLAPKLTPKHMIENNFQKMKVCLAAQIFSRSVAAGMYLHVMLGALPPDALPTIKFIENIDKLFDCFNSVSENCPNKYKRYMTDYTPHIEYLNDMKQYIKSWIIGENPTNNFPFHTGWLISITAILLLWKHLKKHFGFTHLDTRRLNQDPLENFYGLCRMSSPCDKNPKVGTFNTIMKKLTVTTLLEPPESANCLKDIDSLLLQCDEVINEMDRHAPEKSITTIRSSHIDPSFSMTEYNIYLQDFPDDVSMDKVDSLNNLIHSNAIYYFAGYCAFAFLKVNKCKVCKELLLLKNKTEMTVPQQAFTAFKAYCPNDKSFASGLKLSTLPFYRFITLLDSKFDTIFKPHCYKRGVGALVFRDYLEDVLPSTTFTLCSTDSLYSVLRFYISCKIYFAVRMHTKRSGRQITSSKRAPKKKVTKT